jgi:DNA repair exonuclease SbcCD ATPase subunit
MTIDQARKTAQQIKGEIASRKNPLEEKEKQAGEKTFGEAYEEYVEKYAKIENKYRRWKDAEWRLGKVLPYLSEMKLSSITRCEMQGMHSQNMSGKWKIEANKVLACISTIYNKMISRD